MFSNGRVKVSEYNLFLFLHFCVRYGKKKVSAFSFLFSFLKPHCTKSVMPKETLRGKSFIVVCVFEIKNVRNVWWLFNLF